MSGINPFRHTKRNQPVSVRPELVEGLSLSTYSTRSFTLDKNTANTWTILQSIQTYAINFGAMVISPSMPKAMSRKTSADKATELDLYEIAQSLSDKNLSLPVLVRFTDILKDRVKRLNDAFTKACSNNQYQGRYTPVLSD